MDLSRIDLNLLVALDALLAERNVTRAAARLSVGQSAMSSTLGRLRRLFDDPLLVREGRQLQATPFAESILGPLREALAQVDQVVNSSRPFDPRTTHRTFSIMATDYVTLIYLYPLLDQLSREAPHVSLKLFPVSSDASDQLWLREVDLLIHPLETLPSAERFRRVALFRDRYVAVTDGMSSHVDVGLAPSDLTSRPFLATTIANRAAYGDVQLESLGIKTNQVIVASCVLAPFLIRGTSLLTLLPEHLAQYAAAQVDIRLLDPPVDLAPVTEAMLWLPRHDNDQAHRWLRDTFRTVVETFDMTSWNWETGRPMERTAN